MERELLQYVGVILAGLGGFLVGFGYGLYFMFSAIVREIAVISGKLVGWIPLIGGALAKEVENSLYNFLMGYSPNVIPFYIFGFLLLLLGVSYIHYSRAPRPPALQPPPQPVEPVIIRYCKFCGAQITIDTNFCPKCGKPQT